MQIGNEGGNNANMNFEDKRKLLFHSLDAAEETIKGTSLEQVRPAVKIEKSHETHNHKAISHKFHGKESIFKRPDAPISKCLKPRHIPDYQINPHKWKKYSLDESDISDKTNTAAAFAFLKEIERRKEMDATASLDQSTKQSLQNDEESGSDNKTIEFRRMKRPHFNTSVTLKTKNIDDNAEGSSKNIFKGSKVVQEEYVVGQKCTKEKKKKISPKTLHASKHTSGVLKLDHLLQDDEDQNHDEDDMLT